MNEHVCHTRKKLIHIENLDNSDKHHVEYGKKHKQTSLPIRRMLGMSVFLLILTLPFVQH